MTCKNAAEDQGFVGVSVNVTLIQTKGLNLNRGLAGNNYNDAANDIAEISYHVRLGSC